MEDAELNKHFEGMSLNSKEKPQQGQDKKEELPGSFQFGKHQIKKTGSLQVKTKLNGHQVVRTAKIVLPPESIKNDRWDYKSDIKVTEKGTGLITGACLKGKLSSNNSLELEIHDSSNILSEKIIPYLNMFGMTNEERLFWIPQFIGFSEPHIPGFKNDTKLRPFMYAIPLKNLTVLGEKQIVNINDIGVVGGEADNTFYPLIEKLKLQDRVPWTKEIPKVFGVVMAHSFLEAEQMALDRARLTADLINFSLRNGVSHWENRRECKVLEWDREIAKVQVSLWNWVLLREVQSVKGWVRTPSLNDVDKSVDLAEIYDRIVNSLTRLVTISTIGDLASQTGQRSLSKIEKGMITGIQRSLHWYSIASQETDDLDRFIALWVSLETILDCVSYPGVFDGDRQAIKKYIDENIEKAPYLRSQEPLLSISADMLKRRVLTSDWPLSAKLSLLAKSFGIVLQENDSRLVKNLGSLRGEILHRGKHEIVIPQSQLRELEYLIERLIVGTSICSYKNMEDKVKHKLTILPIGPTGGAAPLKLDGRKVEYDCFIWKTDSGEQATEWVIDGLVYDESNSEVNTPPSKLGGI